MLHITLALEQQVLLEMDTRFGTGYEAVSVHQVHLNCRSIKNIH